MNREEVRLLIESALDGMSSVNRRLDVIDSRLSNVRSDLHCVGSDIRKLHDGLCAVDRRMALVEQRVLDIHAAQF